MNDGAYYKGLYEVALKIIELQNDTIQKQCKIFRIQEEELQKLKEQQKDWRLP